MNKNEKSLKDNFLDAVQNYKNKNYQISKNLCYKILSIEPNHFDSILLLSNLYAVSKNLSKAKEFLLKAIDIQPNNMAALNNLGTIHKQMGDLKKAVSCYEKVIKIDQKNTNAHYNLAITFYKLRDLEKAKKYFKKTVEIESKFALAFFNLGNVYVDLKELDQAISSYQKAIELNPNIFIAHNNLGLVYRKLNDFENAIKSYQKTIEIKADHAGAHHNLAMAYKEIGQFENAIQFHNNAIKYEPENSSHYYYLSEIKKDILDTDLEKKIKKISESSDTKKINLAYSNYLLARFQRNSKNYEKEFNYLIKGHQYYFESKKYKFELGLKYCFEDILQIAENVKVDTLGLDDEYKLKPIFIIGVPRSGSTLVEKIIASGKNVVPVGEETSVLEEYVNKKILQKKSLNIGKANELKKELYEIYKNRGLISKKLDYRFTDKSLNNFVYIDIIKKIFPDAKIVNCKRNVLSSIVSIFQNNLTELSWAHNLDTIFRYFNNYFEILKNYNEIYSNDIYEINYENLVNNPEDESKNLMAFCSLPWDKKCLEFYKRKDLISKTTSNIQIRKAIYKDSVNKYEPYKELLERYSEQYRWFK